MTEHTERELYNATDGPLTIDRAGRMLGGHERMPVGDLDVEASPLSGHLEAERMVLVAPLADEPADDQPKTATRARRGAGSTSTQEA